MVPDNGWSGHLQRELHKLPTDKLEAAHKHLKKTQRKHEERGPGPRWHYSAIAELERRGEHELANKLRTAGPRTAAKSSKIDDRALDWFRERMEGPPDKRFKAALKRYKINPRKQLVDLALSSADSKAFGAALKAQGTEKTERKNLEWCWLQALGPMHVDDVIEIITEKATHVKMGIWDISKVDTLRLWCERRIDDNKAADIEAAIEFFDAHKKVYLASGYESGEMYLLSDAPKRLGKIADARDFLYGTVLLETGGADKLLFVLNH